jgi:hypothetical protein
MAYYNHFGKMKYEQLLFSQVGVSEKFRMDKFKNKRRRKDVICVKTGDLSYYELKSKKEYSLAHLDGLYVSHFDKPLTP